ncbi:Uncharacterized protein Adt_04499 [Abeliophyllum distichum]|uniref:Uncharacterized protein n=1 Tax=Abeliophyllum distichum TaxID=126358 RepID=A0ABD1V1F9_9LAMI
MGEIAVFQPQDILKNQSNHRYRNNLIKRPMRSRKPIETLVVSDPNPSTVPSKVSRQKRRSVNSRNSSNSSSKNDSKNMILGKVKILKRGEALTDGTKSLVLKKEENSEIVAAAAKDLVVPTSAGLLGPLPKMLSKQMETYDFYSGSAYFTSPSPNSLPLPSFCKKKSLDVNNNDVT